MDNTGRRLLVGLMAVILAVAIGSAGFMLGYAANGQALANARPIDLPAATQPATSPGFCAERVNRRTVGCRLPVRRSRSRLTSRFSGKRGKRSSPSITAMICPIPKRWRTTPFAACCLGWKISSRRSLRRQSAKINRGKCDRFV